MQHCWFIVVFFLMSMGFTVKAQTFDVNENSNDSIGKINICQDERIDLLLKTDNIINARKRSFTGYRVQIFSGRSTDKERAFEIKKEFHELFPEERAYVVYTAPDFRVRVGNFRTKLESIELYKTCSEYFPNCYPVRTEIKFSDLRPIKKESEAVIIGED